MADRRPDFIGLFAGQGALTAKWFVVEMKGGVRKLRDILRQLQSGLDVIGSSKYFKITPWPQRFVSLVLYDGHVHAEDLGRIAVRFGGRSWPVVFRRCGAGIEQFLDL